MLVVSSFFTYVKIVNKLYFFKSLTHLSLELSSWRGFSLFLIHVTLDANYILASFCLCAEQGLFETWEFHRICTWISHVSDQFYRKNLETEKKKLVFQAVFDNRHFGVANCWKRNESKATSVYFSHKKNHGDRYTCQLSHTWTLLINQPTWQLN